VRLSRRSAHGKGDSPSETPPFASPKPLASATAWSAPSISPTQHAGCSEDRDIYLIGEIIHNPEVNRQLQEMGIKNVDGPHPDKEIQDLTPEDVVIVPAFGTTAEMMARLHERGCQVIDTTCGDVMTVWKRVRKYADEGVTSIIHGKSYHEETKATASRATGPDGRGHYLVVLDLDETDFVCRVHGTGRRSGGVPKEVCGRRIPKDSIQIVT